MNDSVGFPVGFYIALALLGVAGAYAWKVRETGVGIPMGAVLATVGMWYFGDVLRRPRGGPVKFAALGFHGRTVLDGALARWNKGRGFHGRTVAILARQDLKGESRPWEGREPKARPPARRVLRLGEAG
jgi:hypothetical protein